MQLHEGILAMNRCFDAFANPCSIETLARFVSVLPQIHEPESGWLHKTAARNLSGPYPVENHDDGFVLA